MFTSGKWIRKKERAHHSFWKFVTFIAFEFTSKICFQTIIDHQEQKPLGVKHQERDCGTKILLNRLLKARSSLNIHTNLVRPVLILKTK